MPYGSRTQNKAICGHFHISNTFYPLIVRKCLQSLINSLYGHLYYITMKLYYFDPHNYNMTYTVMANSEDEAKQYLLNHLKEKAKIEPFGENIYGELFESYDMTNYHKWLSAFNKGILPDDYNIRDYDEGQIIEGEIS